MLRPLGHTGGDWLLVTASPPSDGACLGRAQLVSEAQTSSPRSSVNQLHQDWASHVPGTVSFSACWSG